MAKIVWNGCDSYVEADFALERGYDFDGQKLFHGRYEFLAFDVVEINSQHLPIDIDGELDLTDVFVTETGKFYKEEKNGY